MTAPHLDLWGKASPKTPNGPGWHPLVCHMLDVGACAEALLLCRAPRLDALGTALRLERRDALPWLVFFVMLHDLGKATPPFQGQVPAHKERLLALGFDFPGAEDPHGLMSAVLLPEVLSELGVPPDLAACVARAVGAHHGAFPELHRVLDLDGAKRPRGRRPRWSEARATLVADLRRLAGLPEGLPTAPEGQAAHAFAADLAGLTTAADWLGSDERVFGYVKPPGSLDGYWATARERAREAVAVAGFREPPRPARRAFVELFAGMFGDGKNAPRPLQLEMERLAPQVSPGDLVIVEAPMGEGKTEAAQYLYDSLAARGADGLYFALPTQATANGILNRAREALVPAYSRVQPPQLVHGGAALVAAEARLARTGRQSIGHAAGPKDEAPIADSWFQQSKRALLATWGVGTVDQALLGVLRARHHFLRLHGLAGKVVIFDEVHAYDGFTSALLARLCEWLRALGATVVLLSATLSSPQRARLLASHGVDAHEEKPYPRLAHVHAGRVDVRTFAASKPSSKVGLVWRPRRGLIDELEAALTSGGSVAWIVNTVARAQAIYLALRARQQAGGFSGVELGLLHARLPSDERLAREARATTAFGSPKNAETRRPRAALLVGTQVLEQSLDFDFDLMISEHCPVDLLLQRAGRLQRHERPVETRGARFRDGAVLWVEQPDDDDAPQGPSFGRAAFVYDEAILLRSWLALRGRAALELPKDIEPLVEEVYGSTVLPEDLPAPLRARLGACQAARDEEGKAQALSADHRLLPSPAESDPFRDFSSFFDDEDPAIHEALRAVTRLGDPSVVVIPVVERDGRLALATNPVVELDPTAEELPLEVAVAAARTAIRVGHRRLVPALLADHPRAFERSGLLRHHRALRLGPDLRAEVEGIPVHLDPDLGLVIGELPPPEEHA